MAVSTVTYSANTAITMDVSSLASSTTFLGGAESTQIDNTTTKYIDAIVNVKGIVGGATVPVVGQAIRLYVWGADASLATTPIDALDGASSAETLTHSGVLKSLRFVDAPDVVVATASLTYYIQPFSVASFFGGVLPKFWGLYLSHNHAGALAATQTDKFTFSGITYTTV